MKVIINNPIESASSKGGTPNGSRAIMRMGEVNGIIESQNERLLSGLFKVCIITIIAKMSGTVIGSMNC